MENKELKAIPGYEGLYSVTRDGQVYSHRKGGFLIPGESVRGYLQVFLCKDKVRYNEKIHRLVAMTYIENPDNLPQVNHIDENKKNNCVENLEWCDCSYNTKHWTRKRTKTAGKRPVRCVETGQEYPTIKAAADAAGRHFSTMRTHLEGYTETCGGLHWKFIVEED